MGVCASCGKDNQAHYKFCLGCGAEIRSAEPARASQARIAAQSAEGARPCPACGATVTAGFQFCPSCGKPVDAAPRVTGTMASRQPGGGGKLVLIRPDGTEGGTVALNEGENLIGRLAGPPFEADGYLSPRHADLTLDGSGLLVRDRGSLNGVFVRVTAEEEIFDGDVFRIGQELLRFDGIGDPVPLEDGTEILGSPNPGYWGRLALIVGHEQDGSAFPLMGDAVVLGRERGDIIFAEDGYVSGTHARVSARDGRFFLADLNSSNGTFLRVRGEQALPPGSLVLLGQQLFRAVY